MPTLHRQTERCALGQLLDYARHTRLSDAGLVEGETNITSQGLDGPFIVKL
jgi:hypothetical protein